MKFELSRDALLKPLQFIAGVVERRQTLPILSNVLLSLQGEELFLTGTDLEVELIMRIKLEKDYGQGEVTVPARKLMDICRSLPEDASLRFELDGNKVSLKSGRSRFSLASLPAADFPEIDSGLTGATVNLSAKALHHLFDQTAFAMAQQDVRYFLNGTLLNTAHQTLTAVATDGHRLSLSKLDCEQPINKETNIIVPRKAVTEIQSLLSDKPDLTIELTLSNNHIRLKADDFILTSKLIDGRYPDYQKVIPKVTGQMLTVDRDVLKRALSRVSVLSNEKMRGVRLELRPGQMKLSANNPEQEQAEDEMEVNYTGEPLEISFNVNYLLDVLNVLSSGDVQLQLSNSLAGTVIDQPEQHPNSLYIVMPMRL
jgi:DNA polymerase-3 subunit beta